MANAALGQAATSDLYAKVSLALEEHSGRIKALELLDGSRVWLKRAEELSPRLRVLKGDATKGLERDRTGLRLLAGAGLPVAPILLEGTDYFVTPDLGMTLHAMILDPETDRADLVAAFASAGATLAELHNSGFCHGRPAMRDICWDGKRVHFIDLECFRPGKSGPKAYSKDLLILLHNILSRNRDSEVLADVMIRTYREAAPPGVLQHLRVRAMSLSWLIPLTAPVRRLKPSSRELHAVPATLQFIWGLGIA